jgi:hypothetical protein
MRRLLIVGAFILVVLALALAVSGQVDLSVVALLLVVALFLLSFRWYLGLSRRRNAPPRSQVAEIERLYFRAMREMLTSAPSYMQLINDLQRILAIDPSYKNARHYLNRALLLQHENGTQPAGERQLTQARFEELQDQLIDLDPAVRKGVVMHLIQYGDSAVDPLIALLMDDDADVRVHAATALGWVGGEDAVLPLLVALQDDDVQVRRYAARALCWVVNSAAIEGLIEALDDEDVYVRCYATRALGWSRDERAVDPLIDLLNDDNADVRDYASTALEDLGQPLGAH